MAVKSMGHLAVATGVAVSDTSACDMTSINGTSSACDMAQFDAVLGTYISVNPLVIKVDEVLVGNCTYVSQGSRHIGRISNRSNNYTWTDENGGKVIQMNTNSGDMADYIGIDVGMDSLTCTYNDGGYNNTATLYSDIIEVT